MPLSEKWLNKVNVWSGLLLPEEHPASQDRSGQCTCRLGGRQPTGRWYFPMACFQFPTQNAHANNTHRQSVLGVDVSEALHIVEHQPRQRYDHEDYE